MSSINTNVAAMTALQSLTATNKSLTETQNRISTGFRVADASDNAAYWSIATTMRSDNSAMSTVQDALGLGAATVDVAYTGINSAIKVVDQIKSKLVAARQPGVDRGKIQSEIAAARHRRLCLVLR
jgi:flagellin